MLVTQGVDSGSNVTEKCLCNLYPDACFATVYSFIFMSIFKRVWGPAHSALHHDQSFMNHGVRSDRARKNDLRDVVLAPHLAFKMLFYGVVYKESSLSFLKNPGDCIKFGNLLSNMMHLWLEHKAREHT